MKLKLFAILCMSMLLIAGCAGKPKIVVCIGDSLTVCGGEGGRYSDWLGEYLPEHKIINKGVNGDTLAGGKARFQRDVLDQKANVVIIGLGANDYWRKNRTIEELQTDLSDMVKRAQAENIKVVIISCFVSGDHEQKEDIESGSSKIDFGEAIGYMEFQVSEKYSCCYVPNMQVDIKPNGTEPYWGDKNHPNKSGNELIAKRILPELKKALKKAANK